MIRIVKDALPTKVLFDLVYSARLMPATEASWRSGDLYYAMRCSLP